MGMRGPAADPTKPNSRTRSKGNRRVGSTAYNAAQLRQLVPGEPAMPSYLKNIEGAAEIWAETIPNLLAAKLINELDNHMLAAFCIDMAKYVALSTELAPKKKAKGKGKAEAEEPKLTDAQRKAKSEEANAAFGRARQLGESFGMSSKSRTGMGIRMGDQPGTTGGAPPPANKGGESSVNKDRHFVLTGQR